MSETIRKYPFLLKPGHRESMASFSRRILAANFETSEHQTFLTRLDQQNEVPLGWEAILSIKTGRTLSNLQLPTEKCGGQDLGCWCDSCEKNVGRRYLCILCARGETIEQRPHFDANVCLTHRRWVGPNVPVPQQMTGGAELVAAERTFRQLRKTGRMTAPFYATLKRCVIVTGTTGGAVGARPDLKYAAMMRIAKALTQPDFIRALFDPNRTYAAAYNLLAQTIQETIPTSSDFTTRLLWLYLRSTFLSLRDSIAEQHPYLPASPHDFEIPADIARSYPSPMHPLEPFSRYLLPTGDNTLNRDNWDTVILHRTPEAERQISESTNKNTTTICRQGHRANRTIRDGIRSANLGSENCSVCEHRTILAGFNDMATTHPYLAQQFHPARNFPATPQTVFAGTSAKLWWTCEKGHEWEATGSNRTANNTNCPVCSHRLVRAAINDITNTHPAAAQWWDTDRNTDISMHSVTAGSNTMAWWLCPTAKHSFKDTVGNITRNLHCRSCDRAAKGNLLVTARPDLAAQLDPAGNTRHDLSKLTVGSKERAEWICDRSHHFEQRIDRRTTGGGCAICHNRRLAQGINDAQTQNPKLATEWHPHLNGFTRPDSIFPGTAQHYWKCLRHGHVHRQSFPNRMKSKGCPICKPEERILNL